MSEHEIFDLDAVIADAIAGDPEDPPFRFKWGGETFELPSVASRDIRDQITFLGMLERLQKREADLDPAEILELIEFVLGADVLAKMRARRPVSPRAAMKLIEAWMHNNSGELGKSSASMASSAGTAARSKRTSRSARGRRTS